MPKSPANVELLRDLSRVLSRRRLRWYVFGAQAVVFHGRPRFTEDVDVTVEVPAAKVPSLVEALRKSGFQPRVTDVDAFVAKARVIPFFHKRTAMPLDVVLAGDGLEQEFLARARRVDIGGVRVPMMSADDVVITKVLAARPQDLVDVEGLIVAQGDALDVARIRRVLGELDAALGDVDLVRSFDRLKKKKGPDRSGPF